MHAAPYVGTPFSKDDPFDAEVAVTLKDGRTFIEKVDRPRGRTSDNPIPPEQLRAKFESCALRVLAPWSVSAVYRAIEELDDLASVSDLTRLLEQTRIESKHGNDLAGSEAI